MLGYHGSPAPIHELDEPGSNASDYGPGIYFASDRADAESYGRFVYQATLTVENPLRIERQMTPEMSKVRKLLRVSEEDLRFANQGVWHALMEFASTLYDIGELTPEKFISALKRMGYDSIIVPNEVVRESKRGKKMRGDYIIVFDASQVVDWRRINGGGRLPQEAIEKYEEFHRHKPKRVGEFPSSFRIPSEMVRGGKALWVTYRSDKVDPETLRRPRNPIDYIHEHNAGVETYVWSPQGFPIDDPVSVEVPKRFMDADALVRLGTCLGFCFKAGGEDVESTNSPRPDLYCTPDGKCLVVVHKRQKVIAMMWGGALGVFARGIDG